MASRKLHLGLTAARRATSRSPILFSFSPFLQASTSHAATVAAAGVATKQPGGSPWASLFSSWTLSSKRPVQQSAEDVPAPFAVDYKSIMPENEFHKLADETIHDVLEKLEEYGYSQQMDGFDIDHGVTYNAVLYNHNQVLTLRLGDLGTYVVNKQTPNRQIWLSSPVIGPAWFDWDAATNSWIYRWTGTNLMRLLEKELGELCGTPVDLS